MNNKHLDSYSLLICSKFFKTKQDFVNIICVCKKFQETTEKLRFNPIPISSVKLFPRIQTQYLYNKYDRKLEEIDNCEICYEITYDQYLDFKKENIKCNYVIYTKENRLKYGDLIPDGVNILGDCCFGTRHIFTNDASKIKEITIPSRIISLSSNCFNGCKSLQSITLPSTIVSLGRDCFNNCTSLKSINIPPSLKSIGDYCFNNCSSLKLVDFPSTITIIGKGCFDGCSISLINKLPSSLRTTNHRYYNFY